MEQEERLDDKIFILPKEEWMYAMILQEFSSALYNYKRYAVSKDIRALIGLKYSLKSILILLNPIVDDEIKIGNTFDELEQNLLEISKLLHKLGITKIEKEIKPIDEIYREELDYVYD